MKEGWVCPRCGKVNAPFIPSCDCKDSISNSNFNQCNHIWALDRVSTSGSHFICTKCGKERIRVYDPNHHTNYYK